MQRLWHIHIITNAVVLMNTIMSITMNTIMNTIMSIITTV